KELSKIGVDLSYHTVVGDSSKDLKNVINIALNRANIIIFTGGLGPTQDDMTKEIVCESLGIEQVLDSNILEEIKGYFKKTNRKMTNNNIKQAYVPKESLILKNDIGTAPGFLINWNNKIIVLLPGPPREMKKIGRAHV